MCVNEYQQHRVPGMQTTRLTKVKVTVNLSALQKKWFFFRPSSPRDLVQASTEHMSPFRSFLGRPVSIHSRSRDSRSMLDLFHNNLKCQSLFIVDRSTFNFSTIFNSLFKTLQQLFFGLDLMLLVTQSERFLSVNLFRIIYQL